jgi:hypothetical protein
LTIKLISNERIAETSSKGNQEKWYDKSTDTWYKLDQFGYEALAETLISVLLERSNIETDSCFTFVRYSMEKLNVRYQVRNGCASRNFLKQGQSLITINRLLTSYLGFPLKQKLITFSSDKKRIAYLADATADYTGLSEFPRYLTLLFEVDALFCNDDRHLNNIAVIEQDETYNYCPIFDNGAGLLSNMQLSQMDIIPKALLAVLRARPLGTTFTRQMNSARSLFGKQLVMPAFSAKGIRDALNPLLLYYAERDRGLIADRIATCILLRQKAG